MAHGVVLGTVGKGTSSSIDHHQHQWYYDQKRWLIMWPCSPCSVKTFGQSTFRSCRCCRSSRFLSSFTPHSSRSAPCMRGYPIFPLPRKESILQQWQCMISLSLKRAHRGSDEIGEPRVQGAQRLERGVECNEKPWAAVASDRTRMWIDRWIEQGQKRCV